MTRYLLDVNLFLALLWPRHTSHTAAHAWFARSGHKKWATNPIVQLGVLRLLTNSAVSRGAVSTAAAIDLLREATSHPNHEFWELNRDIPSALGPLASRLRGHRQWTDALLIAEAARHAGVLVTFDGGVRETAGSEFASSVLVLADRAS